MIRFRHNVRPLCAAAFVAAVVPGTAWAQTSNAGIIGYYSTEPHYGTPNSMHLLTASVSDGSQPPTTDTPAGF